MNRNMYQNQSIQQSFLQNQTLIDNMQPSTNYGLIHDNVSPIVKNYRISEYTIQIHSADRNTSMYPSPFYMKTTFGNNNNTPNIDRIFKNVKYIKLNQVILPRTICIDTSLTEVIGSNGANIYPSSTLNVPTGTSAKSAYHILNNLKFHPYLVLKISELSSNNSLGTSPLLSWDSFLLEPKRELGDMYRWEPMREMIIYPSSCLFNISALTFDLKDELGNSINIVDYNGKNIILNNLNSNTPYNYNQYIEKYSSTNDYVKYTNTVIQVIYDITLGVMESEITTIPNI